MPPDENASVPLAGMPEVYWCYDDNGQSLEYCNPKEVRVALREHIEATAEMREKLTEAQTGNALLMADLAKMTGQRDGMAHLLHDAREKIKLLEAAGS